MPPGQEESVKHQSKLKTNFPMKDLISYPIRALLIIVILLSGAGCSLKEEEVEPSKVTPSDPAPEVPAEILKDFLSSRMNISKEHITYNAKESFFVIDGDMLIDKKEAEKQFRDSKGVKTEQWRHHILVSPSYSHNIKVYLDPSVPADWKVASKEAFKKWNLITGVRIYFSEVSAAASANITVSTYFDDKTTIAANAEFPLSGGKPGSRIFINTHFNSLTSGVKLSIMAHELGHTVGLLHSNQRDGMFVNGTPVADPNSVMNSSVPSWVGFTGGDQTAIRMLYAGGAWRKLTGSARDIGVGADGTVWAIGTIWTGAGGYNILKWNGSSWITIPGAAVRIDVDPSGTAWVVGATGNIYRYNGSGWEPKPGGARDIGIGANGTVWIVGMNANPNANASIYRWNGSGWTHIPGNATRIDVDPSGQAWVVTVAGGIWRYTGAGWTQVTGTARDIGISSNTDGTTFVNGFAESSVWKWTGGSNWQDLFRLASSVSGDPQGNPWITDLSGGIYRYD
jgi:hypothetical protein